jgi:hypothetical protein
MLTTKVFWFGASLLLCFAAIGAQAQNVSQPLKIGSAKQLFIDDFIVDSKDGLARVLHQPEGKATLFVARW